MSETRTGAVPESKMRFAVVASPKSGTTWVSHLLGAHPEIVCAETRPLGAFYRLRGEGRPDVTTERVAFWTADAVGNAAGLAIDAEQKRSIAEGLLRGYIDTAAEVMTRAWGKKVYGEKITPYMGTAGHVVDRLAWYDPEMVVVHLVRDPRDVAVSRCCHLAWARSDAPEAADRRAAADAGRVFDGDLRDAIEHWVETGEAGLAAEARFGDGVRWRYEDLLTDPGPMVADVLGRLGVDSGAETVAACCAAARFEKLSGGRAAGTEARGDFFRSGTAGGWVDWLTPEQAEWVAERCGGLLETFGYERAAPAGTRAAG